MGLIEYNIELFKFNWKKIDLIIAHDGSIILADVKKIFGYPREKIDVYDYANEMYYDDNGVPKIRSIFGQY